MVVQRPEDGRQVMYRSGNSSRRRRAEASSMLATSRWLITAKDDFDNTGIGRTQVGYIEVIEMGQLDPDSTVVDADGKMNAAMTSTHGSEALPNCSVAVNAWSTISGVDGDWLAESKTASTGNTGNSEFLASWAGGGLYSYASAVVNGMKRALLLVTTQLRLLIMLLPTPPVLTCTTSRATSSLLTLPTVRSIPLQSFQLMARR